MRRSLFAVFTGGAVALATVVAGGGSASAAPTSSCAPVKVIAFRASGEAPAVDPESNGYAGGVLTNIIERARQLHFPDGGNFTYASVYGVPYAAFSSDNLVTFALGLSPSVQDGVTKGVAAVQAALAGCAGVTHVVVAGFSQGAMVARRVALAAPRGEVSGAFLLGDPEQEAGAQGVYGPGSGGNGLARSIFGTASDAFYSLPIARFSYCHSGDPICDVNLFDLFSPAGGVAHGTYGLDGTERTQLAEAFTNVARVAAGLPISTGV